jgi:hypothetical protein
MDPRIPRRARRRTWVGQIDSRSRYNETLNGGSGTVPGQPERSQLRARVAGSPGRIKWSRSLGTCGWCPGVTVAGCWSGVDSDWSQVFASGPEPGAWELPGPWQAGMAVNWKSRSVGQLLLGPGSDLSSLERRRLGCESSGSSETWSPGMVLARAAAGRAMESPGRAVGSVSREMPSRAPGGA